MTITPAIKISDRKLLAKNHTILTAVPDTIITTSASSAGPVEGVFLGAVFDENNSRHVTALGTLKDVRFMACFRFKLWWMAQRMGDSGKDVPLETQFLLVESRDGDDEVTSLYTVFLPLIEGPFRACLQVID
ncbi:hypothetical protein Droror1_Dr00023867 [Drosera rotundifolia]